ncbi:MAG TPA: hypothetical protein VNM14_09370 [Planctomycetota bacterium]|jgi:hypothetical protein|nr:hypothetical protein [Planctomycetota bacterium]
MISHVDHDGGSTYYPRIVLCLPGPWESREDLEARLRAGAFRLEEGKMLSSDGREAFEAEYRGPDPRMTSAFQASACRVRPSLTPADFHAIGGHRGVLYVLSDAYGRSTAAASAGRMIEVGQALVDAGAIAVKCESAGIAHSARRWRELAGRIFEAFVRLPILSDADEIYSCGMQLLGAPEGILPLKAFGERNLMAAYRVLEDFLRGVEKEAASRYPAQRTFRSPESGRFLATLEPCTKYEQDDFMWNRWGCYRLQRSTE